MCENNFNMWSKSTSYTGNYLNGEIKGTMINKEGTTGTFLITKDSPIQNKNNNSKLEKVLNLAVLIHLPVILMIMKFLTIVYVDT